MKVKCHVTRWVQKLVEWMDRQTDGRTEAIALPAVLTWLVKLVKLGHVVFELYERTDRQIQTARQTDIGHPPVLITVLTPALAVQILSKTEPRIFPTWFVSVSPGPQ